MYIESVLERDGDGFEYEVVVSDGNHKLLCFADKKLEIRQSKFKLDALFVENFKNVSSKTTSIQKTDDYFGYVFVAKVLNREQGIVKVYEFEMELGEVLPQEIQDGDYIEFDCYRIDCLAE